MPPNRYKISIMLPFYFHPTNRDLSIRLHKHEEFINVGKSSNNVILNANINIRIKNNEENSV